MGYLWHNAFSGKVLMGDEGSRALGFFIGACVMVSGNSFLIFATSSIIFSNVRFPLHDHMRKNHNWSPTQVLVKFVILQVLVTIAILGILLKVR